MTRKEMPGQAQHDIGAGGVGKPGVTGVAYEHPLEGVGKDYRLCRGGGLPHQTSFFCSVHRLAQ